MEVRRCLEESKSVCKEEALEASAKTGPQAHAGQADKAGEFGGVAGDARGAACPAGWWDFPGRRASPASKYRGSSREL